MSNSIEIDYFLRELTPSRRAFVRLFAGFELDLRLSTYDSCLRGDAQSCLQVRHNPK